MKLSELILRLSRAGVESPAYDARALFRRFGGFGDSSLYGADPSCDEPALIDAAKRREAREPLRYILGECGFYRETYLVTPDCLIPREDTEILVDYAVGHLPEGARFADLCTGSGCIALSVLNNTKGTTAVLADLSEGALRVAEKNAKRLELTERAQLLPLDCLKGAPEGKFDAILSNPPYVRGEVYKTLAREIFYEPQMAFVADEGGMRFYRAILENCGESLSESGFFGFEIGYDQENDIKALALSFGYDIEILYDLSANPRAAILHKNP